MIRRYWREWLLVLLAVGVIGVVFSTPPIPQDHAYHQFADTRTIAGIPHFFDVVSNLGFVLVGILGFVVASKRRITVPSLPFLVFCGGVLLVGFGSAYYHLDPTPHTLLWDRLPMTVAFMALFALVIADRISTNNGVLILIALIVAGVASVVYWYWSELQGRGDLRAYALVQFLPMLLIPIMLVLYRGRGINAWLLGATLATYALAKVAEHFDASIYDQLQILSGHTIKHLVSALAVLWVIFACQQVESRNVRAVLQH